MQIPFGLINSHRTIGRVADFCPFCRGFRPFRLVEVVSGRFLYSIPLGPGIIVGHSRVCESCKLLSPALTENYRGVSSDPSADLETLIAQTNPEIHRTWASRMLLEERIQSRKLSAGERAGLLREPFEMATVVLARRNIEGKLDWPTRLGCFGTILLPVACLAILPAVWKTSGDSIEMVAIVAGGACLAFTVLAIVTDARRHSRKAVLPTLITALRPLDPSDQEIDQILESLRQQRSPLPDVVSTRDIVNGLLERGE